MRILKKVLISFLIAFILLSPSFALKKRKGLTPLPDNFSELKFRDVPDSHWAAKSVYKLVKLGVTQGYPDGTFRGTKNMTRFETALFLAKLAENLKGAELEKLSAELKQEFQGIKEDIAESKSKILLSGQYESNYYIGNIIGGINSLTQERLPRGPISNYRIKSSMIADLGEGAKLKINLDSTDAGFYGGSENLLSGLLDVEGTFKLISAPIEISAVSSPGPKRHLFNNPAASSESGRTYFRPYSGTKINAKLFNLDLEFSHLFHNIKDASTLLPGVVDVSQISGYAGFNLPRLILLGKTYFRIGADYFRSANNSDIKPNISIIFNPSNNISLSSEIKIGNTRNISNRNSVVSQSLSFNDKSSKFDIKATVAGGEYLFLDNGKDTLDEWTLIGFDPFDRPYANGSKAVQEALLINLSDDTAFVSKGVIYLSSDNKFGKGHAGSKSTIESGFRYSFNKQIDMNISYRYETDPNLDVQNSDLLISSLSYKF